MTHESLNSDVSSLRRRLDVAKGRRDELDRTRETTAAARDEFANNRDLYRQTAVFLGVIMDETQKRMETAFSEIGTAALEKIFGDGCCLDVKFKKESNTTKVIIRVKQPIGLDAKGEVKYLETDILDGDGGAVVDIIGFTLRIAMLELYSPKQEGPLMLDETFSFVANDERMQLAGEFLREVMEKTERQLILITHERTLLPYADRVLHFILHPGKVVRVSDVTVGSGTHWEDVSSDADEES